MVQKKLRLPVLIKQTSLDAPGQKSLDLLGVFSLVTSGGLENMVYLHPLVIIFSFVCVPGGDSDLVMTEI